MASDSSHAQGSEQYGRVSLSLDASWELRRPINRLPRGTTYAAANSLVSRLVAMGVLSEMTGFARNRRFRYAPYIELFSEEGPVSGRPKSQ